MNRRLQHNGGTIRAIKDRKTGVVIGYQAILPQEFSSKPEGSTDTRYREPIGPRQPTWEGAQRLLIAALVELRDKKTLRHGLPMASYLDAEIAERYQEARREHNSDARANRLVSTWRSICKVWISKESFYNWPPKRIEAQDLQLFFDKLALSHNKRRKTPLSGNFIRNVAALLRAGFERANIKPNPADSLRLPKKNRPKVPHLDLPAQFVLFGCEEIPLRDRVMIGCGMGSGLRVNELLSLEFRDVRLDAEDPHLTVRFGGAGHAPTKGKRIRRVELFEPGIGFWRLWLAQYYDKRDRRLFIGPADGYLRKWPEQFQDWGAAAGFDALTSHYMRHSYAVSMLSGLWGYEPSGLEYVQKQLGHADITTTERYYGAFLAGVWARETRRFTGRESAPERARIVTAAALLGLGESVGVCALNSSGNAALAISPRHSPSSTEQSQNPIKTPEKGVDTHLSGFGVFDDDPEAAAFAEAVAEDGERVRALSVLRDGA